MQHKKQKENSSILSKNTILTTLFFLLFLPSFLSAQTIYGIKRPVEIPFEYYNDFIVVNIIFNKTLPLRFVFDTGAEHTVLLKNEIAQVLGIPFERRFQIIGSDMQRNLYANLIRRIHLEVGEVTLPNQSLLVLEEDYFDFEEKMGMDIQGILGAEIFRAYRVTINYEKRIITLAPSSPKTKLGKLYKQVSSEVYKNKMYLKTDVLLSDSLKVPVKLLVDTGAGLSLLLHTNTHPDLKLPENVLTGEVGLGLGGYLEGYLGRVKSLNLNDDGLVLNEVLTNFQELNIDLDTTVLNERNGLIGNQALRRFEVVLDYPRGLLFLKPSKYYKKKFEFDKSGIVVIVGGEKLNEFYVNKVLLNSPAAEVGIRKGDKILSINGAPTALMNFDSLLNKFKKKTGKKTKLVLRRGDEKVKLVFYLRDLI